MLTKLKNGLAKAVNQVSTLFTGEEVMETEKGYAFSYEEQGLVGAEFSIYARETIYSPDATKWTARVTVSYVLKKDALVERL